MWSFPPAYKRLPTSDRLTSHDITRDKSASIISKIGTANICSFLAGTIVSVLVFSITFTGIPTRLASIRDSSHTPSQDGKGVDIRPTVKYTCGSSPTEARALGCEFEIMSLGWLPHACYDEDLNDDFKKSGPWTYWTEKEGGFEIPEDEVSNRTGRSFNNYLTHKFHVMHCIFTMKKVAYAMQKGGRLPTLARSEQHLNHCIDVILDTDTPWTVIDTRVLPGFWDC